MSEFKEEYNKGGLIAFLFSMVVVFGLIIYLAVVHPGVDLGENVKDPNEVAPAKEDILAGFNIDDVKEPWVSSDKMIAYGYKTYDINCSTCHGKEGKGDGVAGASLTPKPRNFVEGKWTQGEGIVSLYKAISNGIPGTAMSPYGHMKSGDRWAIIHWIDSITNNKSKDDAAKVAEFAKSAK